MKLSKELRNIGRVLGSFKNYNSLIIDKRATGVSPQVYLKLLTNRQYSTSLDADDEVPTALRNTKPKSNLQHTIKPFTDIMQVRTTGGNGGDGFICFLSEAKKEFGGPNGGDGGNGGHVIFRVSAELKDLSHLSTRINGEQGGQGQSMDRFGKCSKHTIVDVPVGTIVRDVDGKILADLDVPGMMYVAARGGAGGHGNAYFKNDIRQSPKICEYGAKGESIEYVLEIRSMAHVGLIGLPNAGKSTLLQSITRARSKVAPYPFTTLRPHIGMIQYSDYEQIAVADLPGLIPDSHKNKGLGIAFLKHAERCAALLFIIDAADHEPWNHFDVLQYEISQFNDNLTKRPKIVIANKMDLPNAEENIKIMMEKIDAPVIPISAKKGLNTSRLLRDLRILYDKHIEDTKTAKKDENTLA